MPSPETLYKINDALTPILDDLRESLAIESEEVFDDMLNDATHAVAAVWWPDE